MKDELIIDLFFKRSEQAIVELSEKYGKICRSISMCILNNEEDVQECINDSYLGIWNTIPPNKPERLKYYLLRIVRNNSLKRYFSNTAKKRNSNFDIALQEIEDCFCSSDSVEQEILLHELTSLINCFLEKQKKENRIIFIRRYFYGDSVSHIAERTGISENYISVKLCRMRNLLRDYLEKEGYYL